jgi:hypothetical protein
MGGGRKEGKERKKEAANTVNILTFFFLRWGSHYVVQAGFELLI